MSDELILEVLSREETGKNSNRRLRASGQIPGVVYGAGRDTVPIQVDRTKILEMLRTGSGENTVFLLKRAGTDQSRHAMIKDMQIDAVSRRILHIDFQRVLLDQKIQVEVPIEIVGEPVGVKTDGGLMDFVTRILNVECLPTKIPDSILAEVEELHIGEHLEAGQLELPEGVVLLDEETKVIVSISHRAIAEEETEDEGEGLIEAEKDEPEVIARGKDEEDEN